MASGDKKMCVLYVVVSVHPLFKLYSGLLKSRLIFQLRKFYAFFLQFVYKWSGWPLTFEKKVQMIEQLLHSIIIKWE